MSGVRTRAGPYLAVLRVQFDTILVYRADFLVNLLGVLLRIYLFRVVWTAVYAGQDTVDGVSLDVMVTFATLATLQVWLLRPISFATIPRRVRTGAVASDLVRPLPFLGQAVAQQLGLTAARGTLLLPVVPAAALVGGLVLAPTPASAAAALVSFALAYAVGLELALIVGLTAFWTLETAGTFMVYRMVEQFMSGALVPLWFMPDALHAVAAALPFQAIVYTPLAVYLGQLTGGQLWQALATQAGWLVLLAVATGAIWSRAERRVVVQGG